jgi:2-keto-myo-inositol isomerase
MLLRVLRARQVTVNANQIAINAITTADAPLDEVCAAYAAAGFRNVEFPLGRIKKYMAGGKSVDEVKSLLREHDLRSIGGFETHVACFGDAGEMTQNHACVIANAQLIAQLGGGILVVGTDGPGEKSREKSFVALDAIGRTMLSMVEKFPSSVSIAVEFNWSPIVKSLRAAKIVCDAANHPRVGILFDPAHFHCTASKFEDLTPAVVAKILHVHVNDMRDKPGELCDCNSDRVLPGDGCLDLRAILGRIEALGYRGFFSLELFNEEIWKLPVAEAARRCYAAMQRL